MKRSGVLLAVLLALPAAPARTAAPPSDPGRGEAVVWYLGHCGYAVRTQHHFLVFDYQEKRDGQALRVRPARASLDGGWVVPDEIRGRRVRVFASHSHSDHYDPVVLEWRKTVPDIQYFYGWRVSEDTTLHCLVGPRAEWKADGMEIATVNSHHSGVPEVAWLVEVDGLVLYHNGDCQVEYAKDLPHLQARANRVDLAFVPRVAGAAEHYGRQNAEFFRRFHPRAVFPMHDSAGAAGYREAARGWRERDPQLPVFVPERLGERFVYRGGTLTRAAGDTR
jgi:L-ascorbate metabolism protein UlaG (beta-lactamase superfamily)